MKKIKKIIVFMLVVALSFSSLSINNVSAASKVKINKKKVVLYVGKTTTLKLKNNKKKIRWTSSNKKIATVSKKGKVKAKKVGKTIVIAKVGKKKYKCTVIVKKRKTKTTTKKPLNNNNETGKCGEKSTYVLSKTGVLTIKGTGKIKDFAFSENSKIKEVYVSEGITEIGIGCFNSCHNILKVSLPNTLKVLNIFWDCEKLTSIIIPKNVEKMYDLNFDRCTNLKEIKVSNENKHYSDIGGVLFNKDKTKLITYPEGKEGKEYNIPASVKEISDLAFYRCKRLEKINISDNVIKIGYCAFGCCSNLKELNIPKGVEEIDLSVGKGLNMGEYAGMMIGNLTTNCEKLQNINVDKQNKKYASVNGVLFRKNDNNLELALYPIGNKRSEYVIPDNVIAILEDSFEFSESDYLTKIIIPKSVVSIAQQLDSNKIAQTIVGYKDSFAEYYAAQNQIDFESLDGNVEVENIEKKGVCGDAAYYTLYKDGTLNINGFGSIGEGYYVFENETKIRKTIIGDGINKIEDDTFSGCVNMYIITIPESVQEIGEDAFDDAGSDSDDELFELENYYGLRIVGKRGTIAEKFAEEQNIRFYELDNTGSAIIKESSCGDEANYKLNDKGLLVIEGSGKVELYRSEFEEYSVKEIVFSEGITEFSGKFVVKKITFPSTMKEINIECFDNDYMFNHILSNITVAENNEKYCSKDGVLFQKVDNGLKLLKYPAQKDESEYVVDENVVEIAENAFVDCKKLTKVVISNNVKGIGNYAFAGCSELDEITISEGIVTIGDNAFKDCIFDKSKLENNSEIDLEEKGAILCDVHKDGMYIKGDTIVKIDKNITELNIPEGIVNIGSGCLYNLQIQKIFIPKSLTNIRYWEFEYCDNLETIIVDGNNTSYSSEDGILYNKEKTELIICPKNKKSKMFIIPKTVINIDSQAFYNCSLLEAIIIPEGVTSIGDSAFRGCSLLKKIDIPKGVTEIKSYTFYECYALEEVIIPEGVTNIEGCAFESCRALKEIDVPKGVTEIKSYTFCDCSALEAVNIPEGVTNIDNLAFEECSSLEKIVIPTSVIKIGSAAFSSCSSLQEIIIPDGVTKIEMHTFSGCSALKKITIPKGVISIEEDAFENCVSLEKIIGEKGSYAEEYAKNNNIIFETLN